MLADKALVKKLAERQKQADSFMIGTLAERFALIQKIIQEKDKQELAHTFTLWENFMHEAGEWQVLRAFEEARKSIFLSNANPQIALSWATMQQQIIAANF